MKHLILLLIFILLTHFAFSQADSPYRTSFKVDAPIIAGGIGLSYWGLTMIKNKDPLTQAEVLSRSKSDVIFLDRGAAGNYSNNADNASYYPLYASFAIPFIMLLNKNVGNKAGQVMVLYLETMAITSTMYTFTAGNVQRSRPLVYSSKAPMSERMDKDAQRSFYAGHTAATAAATFFAAKVFHDFNPDSKAGPYVWGVAAITPAVVGYLRIKSGRHFLSDNIIGYIIGASTGVLIPQLHNKLSDSNISLVPVKIRGYNGLALSFIF